MQDDVRIGDARLHYCRTGRGEKPPLVLLHGFSDNGLCWTPAARDLETEYDVIMPDARAHGLSERARPGEPVDLAADAAGIIRTLGLRRPVVAGHSMGAMTAYQVCVRFPELVRALVLEDPPWRESRPAQTDASYQSMQAWAKNLPNRTLEELLAENRRDHPAWSEEMVRLLSESKKQLDPGILDALMDAVRLQDTGWMTTVRTAACPVLLLTGNPERGAIVTPGTAAKVRALNPRVSVVHFPDVGHLIRFDDYPAFLDAVRAFLKQIPD